MENSTPKSQDRLNILKKIDEYEKLGYFDRDVEDDPPSRTLKADEIEYIKTSTKDKLKTKFTFFIAHRFVKKLTRKNLFKIKEIKGLENFNALESGAVITCNHFNAFDSFVMQLTYEKTRFKGKKNKKFYRVIREGNYTNFNGFYGKLMRNCDTLPLSSSPKTMAKFMRSCGILLTQGNFILMYPEQSMWWNYKKPKPLKPGAFQIAVKNNVPVLPIFITMQETPYIDGDGFNVLEYTVHIKEAIYPKAELEKAKNIENMLNSNFETWKNVYEDVYQKDLVYLENDEK